ncbi:hypothetical protein BKA56DRAFT_618613 [Ilyonectria sp. MPI-CAGE-AT-0026]|nr:hypothetical protein BKA56DRAFT_618613 [Ilyonectria sp. MPI-CAGE-AT-0026]
MRKGDMTPFVLSPVDWLPPPAASVGADALCVGAARLLSDRDMDDSNRSEGWTKTSTDCSMTSSPLTNGCEAGAGIGHRCCCRCCQIHGKSRMSTWGPIRYMPIDLEEDSSHIVLGKDPGAPKDVLLNLTGRIEALFLTGELLVSVPNKNKSGVRMGCIVKGSQQSRCERDICASRESQAQINSADRIQWECPSGRRAPRLGRDERVRNQDNGVGKLVRQELPGAGFSVDAKARLPERQSCR